VLAAALAALPVIASGEEQVQVQAEVVLASNRGSIMDPPSLEKMKQQFSQKGFAFTSYRRLSGEKLTLKKKKPVEVRLPNRRTATVRLDGINQGTASLEIIISQDPSNVVIASTVLTLGREGSLFQHAGDYDGGQLILVLSPSGLGHPRNGPQHSRFHPAESGAR
jgi:hypothetical protein